MAADILVERLDSISTNLIRIAKSQEGNGATVYFLTSQESPVTITPEEERDMLAILEVRAQWRENHG